MIPFFTVFYYLSSFAYYLSLGASGPLLYLNALYIYPVNCARTRKLCKINEFPNTSLVVLYLYFLSLSLNSFPLCRCFPYNKLGPICANAHVTSASSEPETRRPDHYREPLHQLSRPDESQTLLSTFWRWYRRLICFRLLSCYCVWPETAALCQDGEAHQVGAFQYGLRFFPSPRCVYVVNR